MKRFLRFNNWNKNNIIRKNKKTIGIAGVSNNYGVTHISISLANFIHSVLKKNVTYVELRDRSQLIGVVGDKVVDIAGVEGYKYKGVNYVCGCDIQKAKAVIAQANGWIVVDVSNIEDDSKAIYFQCETKIMIGSTQPWKRKYYYERLRTNDIRMNLNNIKFYDTYKNKRKTKEFSQITKQPLQTLPYVEDPFSLKEKNFEALREMIM